MRFSFILIISFITAAAGIAQPRIELREGVEVRFGKLYSGESPQKSVTILNRGNKPLEISSVTSACECARLKLSKSTVLPGKSTKLFIMLNTDHRDGVERKSISVVSNDPEKHTLLLHVNADIRNAITTEPRMLRFTAEEATLAEPRSFQITNISERKLRIVSISDPEFILSFDGKPRILNPKESMMILGIAKPVGGRPHSGTFGIHTDHPRQRVLKLRYFIEPSK